MSILDCMESPFWSKQTPPKTPKCLSNVIIAHPLRLFGPSCGFLGDTVSLCQISLYFPVHSRICPHIILPWLIILAIYNVHVYTYGIDFHMWNCRCGIPHVEWNSMWCISFCHALSLFHMPIFHTWNSNSCVWAVQWNPCVDIPWNPTLQVEMETWNSTCGAYYSMDLLYFFLLYRMALF